jgi:hypothetical protein
MEFSYTIRFCVDAHAATRKVSRMSNWILEVRDFLRPTRWHTSADCPDALSAEDLRALFARMAPEQRPQYRARNVADGTLASAADFLERA